MGYKFDPLNMALHSVTQWCKPKYYGTFVHQDAFLQNVTLMQVFYPEDHKALMIIRQLWHRKKSSRSKRSLMIFLILLLSVCHWLTPCTSGSFLLFPANICLHKGWNFFVLPQFSITPLMQNRGLRWKIPTTALGKTHPQ